LPEELVQPTVRTYRHGEGKSIPTVRSMDILFQYWICGIGIAPIDPKPRPQATVYRIDPIFTPDPGHY